MSLTASIAVLFETMPILRGGVGNVIWFFAFCFGLGLPEITGKRWMDLTGLLTVGNSMMEAARTVIPGYKNGFSLTISPGQVQVVEALRWQGVHWTGDIVRLRVAWFFVTLIIVGISAIFFDRFDATRFRIDKKSRFPVEASRAVADLSLYSGTSRIVVSLTPIAANSLRLALPGGVATCVAGSSLVVVRGSGWNSDSRILSAVGRGARNAARRSMDLTDISAITGMPCSGTRRLGSYGGRHCNPVVACGPDGSLYWVAGEE